MISLVQKTPLSRCKEDRIFDEGKEIDLEHLLLQLLPEGHLRIIHHTRHT